MELGDAILQACAQGRIEVTCTVRDLFQVAGYGEDDIEVIARGRKQVSEQFQVPDVIHKKAWAKGLHQA